MALDYDPEKERKNRAKHGLSLSRALDVELLAVVLDNRKDYGEVRYRGFGRLDGRHVCLAFTYRDAELRPISLRPARIKEMRKHVGHEEL